MNKLTVALFIFGFGIANSNVNASQAEAAKLLNPVAFAQLQVALKKEEQSLQETLNNILRTKAAEEAEEIARYAHAKAVLSKEGYDIYRMLAWEDREESLPTGEDIERLKKTHPKN